jgi:hypothetical protein
MNRQGDHAIRADSPLGFAVASEEAQPHKVWVVDRIDVD